MDMITIGSFIAIMNSLEERAMSTALSPFGHSQKDAWRSLMD